MGALFQFKFEDEGGVYLYIHKSVWEEVRAAVAAPQEHGDFVLISLSGMTQARLTALFDMPISDAEPCKPIVQFGAP